MERARKVATSKTARVCISLSEGRSRSAAHTKASSDTKRPDTGGWPAGTGLWRLHTGSMCVCVGLSGYICGMKERLVVGCNGVRRASRRGTGLLISSMCGGGGWSVCVYSAWSGERE